MKRLLAVIKTIGLVVFSYVSLYIYNVWILTIIFFFLFIILAIFFPERHVLKRLKPLLPVGVFIILIQLIFYQSSTLVNRFLFGYLVFIKIAIVSTAVFFYTSVTSASEIILAFWFLPKKFQLLLTMTFYFVSSILNEAENIALVQKSRGFKFFYLNIFPIIVPLVHRIFQRSSMLALTLVSRGYEENS